MKIAFCTISSYDFMYKSIALFESVGKFMNPSFYCLITDSKITDFTNKNYTNLNLNNLLDQNDFSIIQKKYKGDKLRWGLKPVLLKHLLNLGYDAVIYCDNDVYFFSSPEFLFEKLKTNSCILTPHFYNSDPLKKHNWFEANFTVGLFNAGFIGVSKKGIEILDWWRDCCIYNIKKSFWRGLFDDQKYLDLVPILFNNVLILKNNGCNVAGWNKDYFNKLDSNNFDIKNKVTFIHFTNYTLSVFMEQNSSYHLLYTNYIKHLKNLNPNYQPRTRRLNYNSILLYIRYLTWKLIRIFEQKNKSHS